MLKILSFSIILLAGCPAFICSASEFLAYKQINGSYSLAYQPDGGPEGVYLAFGLAYITNEIQSPESLDEFKAGSSAYLGLDPFYNDETGTYIQENGKEFGATTGRRRRCGWLDLAMMKDSIRYNGLDSIGMTKLDVLTGLDVIKVCIAYELDGKKIDFMPASLKDLARCTPVYEEFPGWETDISSARSIDELPGEAKNYLKRLEEIMVVPFSIISVGPMRDQTIELLDPYIK